jgi:hypothetical protein
VRRRLADARSPSGRALGLSAAGILVGSLLSIWPVAVQSGRPAASLPVKAPARITPAEAWEKSLGDFAYGERCSMIFDADLTDDAPYTPYTPPRGASAMRALARATQRRWEQLDGVQLFIQTGSAEDDPASRDDYSRVVQWLISLSPDDMKLLTTGRFDLSDLTPKAREPLIDMACDIKPFMSFVFLEQGEAASLQLKFLPSVQWARSKTRDGGWMLLHTKDDFTRPAAHGAAPPRLPDEPLEQAPRGPLDFGRGRVLTLEQIVVAARTAFGISFSMDRRLWNTSYFICGSYDEPTFEAAIAEVTATRPTAPRPQRGTEYQSEVKLILANPSSGAIDNQPLTPITPGSPTMDLPLSAADFLSGETVQASQLEGDNPAMLNMFARQQLGPDQLLTLVPGLEFIMDCGGATVIHQIVDGQANGLSGFDNDLRMIIR